MIFARFIWPKRLVALIEQYHADDCLNHENLSNINQRIRKLLTGYYTLIIATICCAIYFFSGINCLLFIIASTVFWLWGLYWQVRYILLNYLIPIHFGIECEGMLTRIVKKTTDLYVHTGWHLRYEFKANSSTYQHKIDLHSKDDLEPTLQKGDAITVFFDEPSQKSIPKIDVLINRYYLKR